MGKLSSFFREVKTQLNEQGRVIEELKAELESRPSVEKIDEVTVQIRAYVDDSISTKADKSYPPLLRIGMVDSTMLEFRSSVESLRSQLASVEAAQQASAEQLKSLAVTPDTPDADGGRVTIAHIDILEQSQRESNRQWRVTVGRMEEVDRMCRDLQKQLVGKADETSTAALDARSVAAEKQGVSNAAELTALAKTVGGMLETTERLRRAREKDEVANYHSISFEKTVTEDVVAIKAQLKAVSEVAEGLSKGTDDVGTRTLRTVEELREKIEVEREQTLEGMRGEIARQETWLTAMSSKLDKKDLFGLRSTEHLRGCVEALDSKVMRQLAVALGDAKQGPERLKRLQKMMGGDYSAVAAAAKAAPKVVAPTPADLAAELAAEVAPPAAVLTVDADGDGEVGTGEVQAAVDHLQRTMNKLAGKVLELHRQNEAATALLKKDVGALMAGGGCGDGSGSGGGGGEESRQLSLLKSFVVEKLRKSEDEFKFFDDEMQSLQDQLDALLEEKADRAELQELAKSVSAGRESESGIKDVLDKMEGQIADGAPASKAKPQKGTRSARPVKRR